ncbi:hypothetical protein AMTRI_Chr12g234650 [Amborella trichopoda]
MLPSLLYIWRCCSHKVGPLVSCQSREQEWKPLTKRLSNFRMGYQKHATLCHASLIVLHKCPPPRLRSSSLNTSCRTFTMSVSLEKETTSESEEGPSSNVDDSVPEDGEHLDSNNLNALLTDTVRANLTKKLSDANQNNRYLKRQLQVKEDALLKFKSDLALMELELESLVGLTEEVTKAGIPPGTRKIGGKYIHSHVLSKLQVLRDKLKEQIKDIDAVKFHDVELVWYGMAEDVQVMGSFDGWSQGEHMSAEYTGGFTKFSTTLKLRPGRYEIKFLVDGEWHLSPEFPTTGEGLLKNNLLIME